MIEAKSQGKTRYFTGVPCPRGHLAERMVSTRGCVKCIAEKKLAWREANPEKENAQKRAWRDANLEKARALNLANQKKHRDSANARNRKYAETHREELRIKNAEWEKANPDKVAERVARRRFARSMQVPAWADKSAIGIIYRAAEVIRVSGFDVHVDHVIPLQGKSVRGLHVHNNLQIISAQANRTKSNRI